MYLKCKVFSSVKQNKKEAIASRHFVFQTISSVCQFIKSVDYYLSEQLKYIHPTEKAGVHLKIQLENIYLVENKKKFPFQIIIKRKIVHDLICFTMNVMFKLCTLSAVVLIVNQLNSFKWLNSNDVKKKFISSWFIPILLFQFGS